MDSTSDQTTNVDPKAVALKQRHDSGYFSIQKTNEWYLSRYNKLTASEIASCLDYDKYCTSNDLLVKKICPLDITSTQVSLAIDWGVKYEPIAIKIYEFITKEIVYSLGLIEHSQYKFIGASPDGLILSGKLLEIKCPFKRIICNQIPYNYWIQIQIQLEVCDLEVCDYMDCMFSEYKSELEYNMDNITESHNKGIITNDSKLVYWKLDQYVIIPVSRDKEWFASNIKRLSDFYDKILYYRQNGIKKLRSDIKRKRPCPTDKDFNKKQKTLSSYFIDWSYWVSASKLRNYIMDDPLLDWLEYYPNSSNNLRDSSNNPRDFNKTSNFQSYIMKKGIEFESNIIKILFEKFYKNNSNIIVTVSDDNHCMSNDKYLETVNHIKNKVPIIYHGVLHDHNRKIFGCPDLIVRIDWLNKLFNERIVHTKYSKNNTYYVIVDIKNTKLVLCADGCHLRNTNKNILYNKSQLYVYNKILGDLQGYLPSKSYIIGNSWYYVKENEYHSGETFDKPATINFKKCDSFIRAKTSKAIKWIRLMRKHGATWTVIPPSVEELRPNMCNYSERWDKVKNYIANKTNDITKLWMCSVKHRTFALQHGITNWRCHKNLTVDKLNITGHIVSKTLQLIIDINQDKNIDTLILPHKVNTNLYDWRNIELEFYVDFETITDAIMKPSSRDESETVFRSGSIIFMIGVGHWSNGWNFKWFIAENLTLLGERKMFVEFHDYIASFSRRRNKTRKSSNYKPRLWHWGHAERSLYNTALNRHIEDMNITNILTNWCDLLCIFKTEPIVIKGALNFSLKTVVHALNQHNIITTNYIDSNINNGLNAMVYAYDEYEKCNIKKMVDIKHSDIINNIIKYNEIDCKVLYEILLYMRQTL